MAIVTANGSNNSHTAIFARTMGIPAVIGLGDTIDSSMDGSNVIVDGSSGKIIINPEADISEEHKKQQEKELQYKEMLQALKGKDNQTLDGRKINVFANIGSSADTSFALQNDAGGIGLFRSEFLYLQSSDYPTEETQFNAYKGVLVKMDGRKVIIRTLDDGADKQIDYFDMEKEDNPTLGYRAIRICLTRPELFKTQLSALYRASVF